MNFACSVNLLNAYLKLNQKKYQMQEELSESKQGGYFLCVLAGTSDNRATASLRKGRLLLSRRH